MAFAARVSLVAKTILPYLIGWFYALPFVPFLLWSFIRNSGTFRILRKTTKRPECLDDKDLGTHDFACLQDVRLHYVVNGDVSKPLMLFLHGFLEFWYSWRHQLKEFCKDYRVVAVDMRGYNESEKPKGGRNYRMTKLTDDIKQLIPMLGYKSCILVAHDWGGIVGHQFTTDNPNMVDKLVIMNSVHPETSKEYMQSHWSQFRKSWYIYLFQLPYVPEMLVRNNDMNILERMFTSKQLLRTTITSLSDVYAYKHALSHPGAITAAVNYYRGIFDGLRSLSKPVEPCDVPILIIWGMHDATFDRNLVAMTEKMYKKVIFKEVREAGHFPQFDTPDIVNKLMRKFLADRY